MQSIPDFSKSLTRDLLIDFMALRLLGVPVNEVVDALSDLTAKRLAKWQDEILASQAETAKVLSEVLGRKDGKNS